MKIGVRGPVFTGNFDFQGLILMASGAQGAGVGLLEIPLMDPEGFDASEARKVLDDSELSLSASPGITADKDMSITNPAVVSAGRETLFCCLNHLAEMGGSDLWGVLYSAMKKYDATSIPQGLANNQKGI